MSSAICFNLDESKILSFGNGLRQSPWKDTSESFPSTGKTQDTNESMQDVAMI